MGFIETLNPVILSMTVLKDVASASLYGAKGANGVVLITTKKERKQASCQYGGEIRNHRFRLSSVNGRRGKRELIHEGLVNFQLDKGVSEQEAQQYADANIAT